MVDNHLMKLLADAMERGVQSSRVVLEGPGEVLHSPGLCTWWCATLSSRPQVCCTFQMDPTFFFWIWWDVRIYFGTVLSEDPIWILHEDVKEKEFMKLLCSQNCSFLQVDQLQESFGEIILWRAAVWWRREGREVLRRSAVHRTHQNFRSRGRAGRA